MRDSAGDVAGYVLGCLDSGEFHRVVTECYFPKMATHYPPTCDHAYLTQDEVDARASCVPGNSLELCEFEQYPSHLHIDLLDESARGHGLLGSKLIRSLLKRMEDDDGSTGCFVEAALSNERALAFYRT